MNIKYRKTKHLNNKIIERFIILIIICFIMYLFSNILLLTNKIDFYINKHIIFNNIKSSAFVETDFLKSRINKALPIVAVVCNKNKSNISPSNMSKQFKEFVVGFNIKNPTTIISNQIIMMKKYDPKLITALTDINESKLLTLPQNISDNNDKNKVVEVNKILPQINKENKQSQNLNKQEENAEFQENISDITHISVDGCECYKDIKVKNETNIKIDIEKLLKENLKMKVDKNNCQVLIVHTHTCEAYTPTKKNYYVPSDPDRTEDYNYNIVRVGDEIEKELKKRGISVLHDKTVHDYPSYSGCYSRSYNTMKKQLKNHPSIRIIIDVHRDALIFKDGSKLRVCSKIEGKNVAQIMFVIGTGELGLSHPNWKENFKLVLKMQNISNKLYPGLARPINLRKERFSQHVNPGCMLMEIGSNGNTLEEAIASSRYIAEVISQTVNELKQ